VVEDSKFERWWPARAALLWLVLSVFEIALVGKIDPQETPVGIGVALLAVAMTFAAVATAGTRYGMRFAWIGFAALVARNVVRDTFVVYRVVLRRLFGGAVADGYLDVPFDPGGDDPRSAGRRALAVAAMSTSPNEIVLAIDAERRTMKVHVLAATGTRRHSAQWPL